ncbi:SGNH/GDSL hydrolase family protein [Nocardioides marmoriginsengisoli]|uniref:SGNH/GDSL hydrolase family protein n=1 Tax=Nocardioides marmoriginsengisoli TaxID=661483 RepID=A0A3N0CAL3_9ACTN|nr:SGNH/GDSL hydrolase family protein [Nocardioides marmoriginsengisoli]RNL60504.1 SGNH/GDSL hydrolase family protein [Nocardioides marmoriginsengisoli]
MAPQYRRFVALGDSQTEGCNDPDPAGGWRGWADRFAERLAATTSPELTYANLAVGGCRSRHVRQIQLPAALALEPDLASVVVGMNDLLRHDYDLEATVAEVEETFAALRATGCRVLTMTFPDVALMLPVMRWLRPREEQLNGRLVEAAARHGVEVLDLFSLRLSADPAMWSHDRIHGSSVGHARIAAGMCELLGLPDSDHAWAVPASAPMTGLTVARRDAWWVATFVAPFLARQVRGAGSDKGAKRPQLLPVRSPENDEGSRQARPAEVEPVETR